MSVYGQGQVTDVRPRCWQCSRVLAELVSRPWRIKCGRCRAFTARGTGDDGSVHVTSPVVKPSG